MVIMECVLTAASESVRSDYRPIRPLRFASFVNNLRRASSFGRCCNMKEHGSVLQQLNGIPNAAARNRGPAADVRERCKALKHMIGNTPLLAIRVLYHGKERMIY